MSNGVTRESMELVALREISNGRDTTSAIRKAAAEHIPSLADPHGHEARCLDKALKSLSTKGRALIERVNPPGEYRNVWALTPAGELALHLGLKTERTGMRPDAPMVGMEARAIAAESRADGLAEKLDEERAERKRLVKELHEVGESFEQVWELRCKLAKRRQRLLAKLRFLDALIAALDNVKDPTVPF